MIGVDVERHDPLILLRRREARHRFGLRSQERPEALSESNRQGNRTRGCCSRIKGVWFSRIKNIAWSENSRERYRAGHNGEPVEHAVRDGPGRTDEGAE